MRESKCEYIGKRDFSSLLHLVLLSNFSIYSSHLLLGSGQIANHGKVQKLSNIKTAFPIKEDKVRSDHYAH